MEKKTQHHKNGAGFYFDTELLNALNEICGNQTHNIKGNVLDLYKGALSDEEKKDLLKSEAHEILLEEMISDEQKRNTEKRKAKKN